MGLSASQARLLSLTARISDNELHSQTVANSKVRLADKSQDASKEYIRSLNSSKLVYITYDANGEQTQLSLTPSLMYQFSSLKNQYGISNTAGQLLISQSDASNFETSSNLDDFLERYGVDTTEESPETAWYINLWHRLNGTEVDKSLEGENATYYKILEDNLYENADWLQFALEHGVVALEQVVFVENAELDTGLNNAKWQHTMYSSAVDIVTVEDEVAIQIAEAEYNKKLKDIESKDKKYDMDLKKLDTEHNALQQEYESLKNVIQKNAERSFKAFS